MTGGVENRVLKIKVSVYLTTRPYFSKLRRKKLDIQSRGTSKSSQIESRQYSNVNVKILSLSSVFSGFYRGVGRWDVKVLQRVLGSTVPVGSPVA